jgi:thioredoxin 1
MVTELTDADFKSTLDAAQTPILVDFSASWCGPCKALAPTIDKVAGEYEGKMSVYKVDIDNAQETAASFGIMSVPTCIFFRDGKEVDRFMGNADLRTVKSHVDRVLA